VEAGNSSRVTVDLARHAIELHAWPHRLPGERSRVRGVLALHKPTGFAVHVDEVNDYDTNRVLAVEQLLRLLCVEAIYSLHENRPQSTSEHSGADRCKTRGWLARGKK
jgi:hypothetical protein